MLEQQRWPGNLRQLRHMLRTMIALRHADCLTLRDVPPDYHADAAAEARHVQPAVVASAVALAIAGVSPADDAAPAAPDNPLASAERQVLLHELARHDGNLSGVARALGISRNTLYRKLQRFDITWRDKSLIH